MGDQQDSEFAENCDKFCAHASGVLRKSDLVMQCRKNQIFIFLTDIKEDAIAQVVGNIIRTWNRDKGEKLSVSYEVEFMESDDLRHATDEQPWVAVVDDDIANLKLAGHIARIICG